MVSLFHAEWQKITGNRWVTSFLIWIFPVATLFIAGGAVVVALLSEDYRSALRATGVYPWDKSLLTTWPIVNNYFGRWIILAFTANIFAGEYQHGTWKNLTIHRQRPALIVNKFVALAVFVTFAFTLVSLINGIGSGILANIVGVDYGLSTAGDVMGDFLREYGINMFTTLAGTFVVAAFAALAAMITKNILASVIVGIIFNIAETVGIIFFFGLVNWILKINLFGLYIYLPTYNLENIASWIRADSGLPATFAEHTYTAPTLAGSLFIIAAWAFGLVAVTAYLFQRQDITT